MFLRIKSRRAEDVAQLVDLAPSKTGAVAQMPIILALGTGSLEHGKFKVILSSSRTVWDMKSYPNKESGNRKTTVEK